MRIKIKTAKCLLDLDTEYNQTYFYLMENYLVINLFVFILYILFIEKMLT